MPTVAMLSQYRHTMHHNLKRIVIDAESHANALDYPSTNDASSVDASTGRTDSKPTCKQLCCSQPTAKIQVKNIIEFSSCSCSSNTNVHGAHVTCHTSSNG
jgi:hypothetical protein